MKNFILMFFLVGISLPVFCSNPDNPLTKEDGLFPNPFSEACFSDNKVSLGFGPVGICGGESWKTTLGVQLGADTKFHRLSDNLDLSAGVNLSLQGASYKEPMYTGAVRLSYIGFPVMVNYRNKSRIYAEAGIQPGFLLFARDMWKDDYGTERGSYRYAVRDLEFSVPIGFGYQVTDDISLGLRAVLGLRNNDKTGSPVKDRNAMLLAIASHRLEWERSSEEFK